MKLKTDVLDGSTVVFSFMHEAPTQAEAQVLADEWMAVFQTRSAWQEGFTTQATVAESAAQETMRTSLKSQEVDVDFGKTICTKILALAGSKAMSEQDIDNLFDNALLMKLERMLKSGSISTAKRNMESADLTGLLTADEKTAILAEMAAYLG